MIIESVNMENISPGETARRKEGKINHYLHAKTFMRSYLCLTMPLFQHGTKETMASGTGAV